MLRIGQPCTKRGLLRSEDLNGKDQEVRQGLVQVLEKMDVQGDVLKQAGEAAAGEAAAGETAAGETAAGETAAGETAAAGKQTIKFDIRKVDKAGEGKAAQMLDALKVATLLTQASIIASAQGSLGTDNDILQIRKFYKRGIRGLRWKPRVWAPVRIADFQQLGATQDEIDKEIEKSHLISQYEQQHDIAEMEIRKEKSKKTKEKISYQWNVHLESARTPDERYRKAIMFIPHLKAHKVGFNDTTEKWDGLVAKVEKEIHRRFRSTTPHPLFFNEVKQVQDLSEEEKTRVTDYTTRALDQNITLRERLAVQYIAEKPASKLSNVVQVSRTRGGKYREQSKSQKNNEKEVEKLDEIYGTGAYVNDKGHTYQNYKPLEVPEFE